MRPIVALALPVLFAVAACSIPTPLTVVTFAFDGVSLIASGKTLSDHALSTITNEDCAMWRVFKDRPICRNPETPDTVLAAVAVVDEPIPVAEELSEAEIAIAETAPETEDIPKDRYIETVSASRPQREVVALAANEAHQDIVATPAVATPMEMVTIASLAPAAAKPTARHFIILGSYLKEANAKDAMARGRDFAPRMVRVRVRGKLFHRVLSGPYARDAISTLRKTLAGEGFRQNWTIKLCENSLRAGPCHTMPVNVATGPSAS
ncbi:MAG: hypothetical protein V3T02_12010 [Alphaproteobacteria bacterium]